MALSTAAAQKALIAYHRFGLGPKPGGMAGLGDPLAALRAEVQTANVALINNAALPTYAYACSESQSGSNDRVHAVQRVERNARIDKQLPVGIGFVERLVMFWSNHFAMEVAKGASVRGTIGQWERDVIRRHVLGKFSDMLRQTYRHPAIIAYLDNDDSVGPNTAFGIRRGRGLNLNLARELMELHTLGSDGGYNEADVVALANILTGWSYVRKHEADNSSYGGSPHNRGQFIYRPDWHEPGSFTLMGRTYAAVGQQQLEQVLARLAAHPSTAEHIAFKMVRHFITDAPTPAMVEPIKQKFLETNGDLKAVALALLALPEAWSTPLNKFRTPYEFMIGQFRALGRRYGNSEGEFSNPLQILNNNMWEPYSPEGFPDVTAAWLNADALRVRLDFAKYTGIKLAPEYKQNVSQLAVQLFDSALSDATRTRIANAGSNNNALIILFACPEFNRR